MVNSTIVRYLLDQAITHLIAIGVAINTATAKTGNLQSTSSDAGRSINQVNLSGELWKSEVQSCKFVTW